jgi:threonine dehydrogenase-like Zn-dependent dehydrogenase
MKAFVMKKLDAVGFMDKPIPKPGPNDAVIRTTRALICTSDSHTVHGAIGPRENLTLGHEAVGVVQEVGSEVRLFKPGDRVVVGAITPTGATSPRKPVIPRNQVERLQGGSLPTSRTASSLNIFTSTRPMRTWR